MKMPTFQKTKMLSPTPGERLTANPAVVLLFFFLIMTVTQSARTVLFRAGFSLLEVLPLQWVPHSVPLIIQLFATVATVAGVLLYCLLAERRSLLSLGFTGRGMALEYAVGLMGGLMMFGGAVLLCVLTGTVTVTLSEETPSMGLLLLFFLGFLIQGMSEEILCRSYLMVSLSRGFPLWLCAVINALLFALLHLGNTGISAIALVNIFLFGLFASFLTLRRGSIWMAGALHSMWNFAQGNLFGIPVSGIRGTPSPLASTLQEGVWQELINGGTFGLEGGLAVTAVLAIACAVVLFVPTKKSEIAETD